MDDVDLFPMASHPACPKGHTTVDRLTDEIPSDRTPPPAYSTASAIGWEGGRKKLRIVSTFGFRNTILAQFLASFFILLPMLLYLFLNPYIYISIFFFGRQRDL